MTLNDINSLVDEIQQVLRGRTAPTDEELMELAGRHDEFVVEVTSRLRQVETLLSQGLRLEAIQQAELDPDLNDVVTALDFPEFDAWNDLLGQYDIQPVRALPLDIASDLNDAYGATGSLERLLQQFRTLSLAKAPISQRIGVLRRLTQRDSGNPVWLDDLKTYEKHRVGELRSELEGVVRLSDLSAAAALDTELSGGDWVITVPPPIVKQARALHQQLRRAAAMRELQEVAHRLSDCYADFDRRKAIGLRQRFLALADVAELSSDDSLHDVAGPALDWLAEEDQRLASEEEHRRVIRQLEQALDGRVNLADLERLYHLATRHSQSLPPSMESRVQERLDRLQTEARRRRTLISSLASLAGIVAVVCIVLFVRHLNFRNQVSSFAEQVAELMVDAQESGELQPVDDCLSMIRSQNPDVLKSPELVGLQQQLESLRLKESGRHEQMETILAAALQASDRATDPDQTAGALREVDKAGALAKTESDKAQVLNTRQSVQEKQSEIRLRIDSTFGEELQRAVAGIESLPTDRLDGYDELLSVLSELQARRFVSPDIQTSARALYSRVDQQKASVKTNLEVARSLLTITENVGSRISFERELHKFINAHPGTLRAEDFQAVLSGETTLWEGANRWNQLRERLQQIDIMTVLVTDARQFITDYDEFLQSSGPYPGPMNVETHVAALRAIAGRKSAGEGSVLDDLWRVFEPRTISNAYVIPVEDPRANRRVVYFADAVPVIASNLRFEHFTTPSGTQTSKETVLKSWVPFADRRTTPEEWMSPQTLLFRSLQKKLGPAGSVDFDAAVVTIITDLCEASEMDPILRLLLIEQTLEAGSKGSIFIAKHASPLLIDISRVGVSRLANWLDYDDKSVGGQRTLAGVFLSEEQCRTISERVRLALEDRQALSKQAPGPPNAWVGWLHRQNQGDWVVSFRPNVALQKGAELFCICPPGTSKPSGSGTAGASLQILGTVTGQTSVQHYVADPPAALREGRPVFQVMQREEGSVANSSVLTQ